MTFVENILIALAAVIAGSLLWRASTAAWTLTWLKESAKAEREIHHLEYQASIRAENERRQRDEP